MTDNDHPRWARKVMINTIFGELGWYQEREKLEEVSNGS